MENIQSQPIIVYASSGQRIFAAIVDGIVLICPYLAVTLNAMKFQNMDLVIATAIVFPFAGIAYSVFGHYFFGQTLGKAIVNIKVVDHSTYSKLTWRQALLRDSPSLISQIAGSIIYALVTTNIIQSNNITESITEFLEAVTTYWFWAEFITMLFNKKRRAIHDFIAETAVIKTTPS
jgi:uncharacterized RDD family membrane protein YckC